MLQERLIIYEWIKYSLQNINIYNHCRIDLELRIQMAKNKDSYKW